MEWQKIETAPKDGAWILGFTPNATFEDQIKVWRWYEFREGWAWQDAADAYDCVEDQPTHWMPLPAAPQ